MGRYNHSGVWKTLGSTLHFQDALSGALLLPVLPALVGQLLRVQSITTPTFSTAWLLAVMVACYYVGRSGTLVVAARLCSGSSPRGTEVAPPSLMRVGALLVLSAAAYLACGVLVVVERQQQQHTSRLYVLLCFGLFRSLAGCLAAGHRWFACRCLDHAELLDSVPLAGKSRHESAGAMGGLVAGYTVAGSLYIYSDPSRLTPLLCWAAAAAHAPTLVSLLHVARKRCCGSSGSGSGDGDTIDGGYSTVRGTPGGSDADVELMGQPPWSARDDLFDGGRVAHGPATVTPSAGMATPDGDDVIVPGRYLRGCNFDAIEAERRWRLTLDWRAKERIDEVRLTPVLVDYVGHLKTTAVPAAWIHHRADFHQAYISGQTEQVARKLLPVGFFLRGDDREVTWEGLCVLVTCSKTTAVKLKWQHERSHNSCCFSIAYTVVSSRSDPPTMKRTGPPRDTATLRGHQALLPPLHPPPGAQRLSRVDRASRPHRPAGDPIGWCQPRGPAEALCLRNRVPVGCAGAGLRARTGGDGSRRARAGDARSCRRSSRLRQGLCCASLRYVDIYTQGVCLVLELLSFGDDFADAKGKVGVPPTIVLFWT